MRAVHTFYVVCTAAGSAGVLPVGCFGGVESTKLGQFKQKMISR